MASPAGQKTVFRFGLFEADPESGELLKQGEHLRLQDQPFRMLILLLQRPGEVISREELREKLWPGNTFVEFDNGLNVAVKKIRDALGDSAENPRFVETVPRRGYRFIAPVSIRAKEGARPAPELSPPRDSTPESPAQTHVRRGWRVFGWAAGLVVIAVASAIIFSRINLRKANNPPAGQTTAGTTVTPRRIVAVLEFQNVSRHPADDWLSTAIAEMITTELGAGEKLHLVPAEDVSRMKRELHLANSSNLARETAVIAAKNLKADMLVLGSFTAMGTGGNRRVRVDVRMQDSSNGEIVAEVAETEPEEQLFELVARAGSRLREALGLPGLSLPDQAAARALLPSNAVASRLYAEGLARLRVLDAAGARDLFIQAIAAEPKFPLSHMALASAWRTLGYDQKARGEAKKALDLSAHLPRADQLLIEGRYREMTGEIDQAIAAYRALFTLFPDSLEDGLLLANAQSSGGKLSDALATVDMLRKLPEPLSQDPRIDLRHAAVLNLQGAGIDARLTLIRRAEEKGKAQGAPLLVAQAEVQECSLQLFSGHYDDATRACEDAHRAFAAAGNAGNAAQAIRFLGDIRMRRGRLQEALELFQQALKISQAVGDDRGMAVAFNEMAIVYEGEGDLKHAEEVYRRAYLLFLKVGHLKNAAILASNVGGTLLEQGKLAEAEGMLGRAMELSRQGGSMEAEAAVHRTLAELARLRGRLADALDHTKNAESIEESDPVAQMDDLGRRGRILAAQGDLAGARAKQQEALAVAQKTGAKAQAAQSRIDLAELDLEEGKPAQAEQPIREAMAVFGSEKMLDDELNAHVLLSRCLLAQGKVGEAMAALHEVRSAVVHNQNPANRLSFTIAEARATTAALPAPSQAASQARAKSELNDSIATARRLGFVLLEFEARLAAEEVGFTQDPQSGGRRLESLEREAQLRGLGLIAQKAARVRLGNR
jgi:DNA-binding winged helix-turn-helix (wHTH) protein/tetratricopeptide (TPR) repeat protein